MAQQRRQRVATDIFHTGWTSIYAGPSHPLRQHRQKEMGRKLRLHGPLRLRRHTPLLGAVGLPDGLRRQAPPLLGQRGPSFGQKYLTKQAVIPESAHRYDNGTIETPRVEPFYPMATLVYFQFTFAAITIILLAGSVLGRMSIKAWMLFVPLWLIFSYTVGAFSLWGGGFFYQWVVIDYSGGYVIHLSSGGYEDKGRQGEIFAEQCVADARRSRANVDGLVRFNGGAPRAANVVAWIAVLNTNVSAATSLLVWTTLDVISFGKPSVIGAVQGMITGLACVTPGAGVVQTWAAMMGILAGSIPWVSMMILHKKSALLQKVDDTLGVFHTHAVSGLLGGLLTGLLAEPTLCDMSQPVTGTKGAIYGSGMQFVKQLVAAMFVIGWNFLSTTIILLFIRLFVPLRMPEEDLMIGDDAVHGEEAYALWGDGEKFDPTRHGSNISPLGKERSQSPYVSGARGVTIDL